MKSVDYKFEDKTNFGVSISKAVRLPDLLCWRLAKITVANITHQPPTELLMSGIVGDVGSRF